jgi:hypothetical protein
MNSAFGKTLGEAQPTIAMAAVLTFTCSHDRWLVAFSAFVALQLGFALWALRQRHPRTSTAVLIPQRHLRAR